MKKYVLFIIIIFISGCDLIKDDNPTNNHQDIPIVEKDVPKYQDDNPVKISLYVDNAFGGLDKVDKEFRDTWRLKRDIVVFGSVFSVDEKIESDYFQNIWKKYANNYENYQKYKTAWHVNFTLKDGTNYDQVVFTPGDVNEFYDYLEIYLYDSANVPIGVWYSHLTEEDMNDNTIMTSMKLTAGSKYEEIDGEITVSVFTYDSEDDFDENGKYRGNSVSTVKVYNN